MHFFSFRVQRILIFFQNLTLIAHSFVIFSNLLVNNVPTRLLLLFSAFSRFGREWLHFVFVHVVVDAHNAALVAECHSGSVLALKHIVACAHKTILAHVGGHECHEVVFSAIGVRNHREVEAHKANLCVHVEINLAVGTFRCDRTGKRDKG